MKKNVNKEVFRLFSRITLYYCNKSDRKIYLKHMEVVTLLFIKAMASKKCLELVKTNFDKSNVIIDGFDNYIKMMEQIGFIEIDTNLYGDVIIPKKSLEDKAYENREKEYLNSILSKNIDELKIYLDNDYSGYIREECNYDDFNN